MPVTLLVLLLMLGVPSVAAAQSGDTPDFLFGRPRASIGLRGSWQFARAGSDLFRFVEENLTIDRKDFNAPAVAADLGIRVTERIFALKDCDAFVRRITLESKDLAGPESPSFRLNLPPGNAEG